MAQKRLDKIVEFSYIAVDFDVGKSGDKEYDLYHKTTNITSLPIKNMNYEILINIDWKYLLGIVGTLVLIAWYANGRFTALETSMQWVKDTLHDLKVNSDNSIILAFSSKSPVNLTKTGEEWLLESGLKEYINAHKDELMKECENKKETNPYEVQKHVFKMFDIMNFDSGFEDKLKKFAFEKGSTMNVVRRVGAIYFRNLCLDKFGMTKEDIDKHDPEKPTTN